MKRFKLVVPSFIALIFCMLLIAGSTFALFTSEAKADISVTSGKVKINANFDGLEVYSAKVDPAGELVDENGAHYSFEQQTAQLNLAEGNGYTQFVNQNSGAKLLGENNNRLSLVRMTPGDKVKATLELGNESNVNIKYRVRVNLVSGLKLFEQLQIKLDGVLLQGVQKVGTWTYLAANTDINDIAVEVYFPITSGNDYQELSTEINFTIEAVQGNAATTNETLNTNINVSKPVTQATAAQEQVIQDEEQLVTVTIPANAVTVTDAENTTTSMEVKVKPQDTVSELTLVANQTAQSYDLDVIIKTQVGSAEPTTEKYNKNNLSTAAGLTIKMFVGEGLKGVKLYHKSVELTKVDSLAAVDALNEFYYDSESGYITLMTNSFSEYTVVYNKDLVVETIVNNESQFTTYEATSNAGVYEDENGNAVTINEGGDIVEYDGLLGNGTKSDPFLVYDYETMQKISEYYDLGYYYFAVDMSKTDNGKIDCSGWVPVYLCGSFDGNGVVLNNLDKGLFDCVDGESSVIRNFIINANISRSSGVGAVVYDSNTLNLTIDSVDVHGTIIGANWVTPYVEFGPGPSYSWNLTIKNCLSDANLVATSGVASGFVGHPYDDVSNGSLNGGSLITIIDSAFIGNMSATGSTTAANNYNFKYFTINGNNNRVKTYYSDSFIEKLGYNPEGTLYATPTTGYDNKGKANEVEYLVINNEDGSKTFFCGNYGKNVVDHYKVQDKKASLNTTAQASLPANIGDVFTVTKVSGATKAIVSLQIAPNDQNNYGSYLGTYMSEEIDISSVSAGSTFTSKEVRYFTININSEVTSKTGVSGDVFNVVNSFYGVNAHNGATVKIVQFDANGNVLNITSVTIAQPHLAE